MGSDDGPNSEGNSPSMQRPPSEANHPGHHQHDIGKGNGKPCCNDEMFKYMANAVERSNTLNEFWRIVNKEFATEDEAFEFYNKYAFDKGFSVRRGEIRRIKRKGAMYFRRFLCSNQGERDEKHLQNESRSRRPRSLTRCICAAHLDIKLDRSRGVWFVDNFVDEHNHRLATPDEAPFLWSHRKLKDFQKTEIRSMEASGIRKNVIMDVLQCRYGGYDKFGFVRKDIYNYFSRYKRARLADGDANEVLRIMLHRQKIDPDFYFDYQRDKKGRLRTMFWCDTQSRLDYQSFGDVVVFDGTYRMNRYKMPFVPFVGLNHHRSTTVFGCGIVSDERVSSYVWLLETFLKAMCQQKPKAIITDGCNSMMAAIGQILPGVPHRLCTWHIEKNIPKHLHWRSIKDFRKLMYNGRSVASWTRRWNKFIADHKTSRNKQWLAMMYKNRELWAAAFQHQKMFLGMKSNQRSESLNSSLHRHLRYYMSLEPSYLPKES